MLEFLKVRNYAIIDELEIHFSPHLNIITGETGAGKSILLGALGLILGNRADSKNFYNADEKCTIEAEFKISEYDLAEWFEEQDLDYADTTLIRREIQLSGRNRVFINDTPVSLQQLQDFTSRLVDIHQQFSLFDIQKPAYQLELYDAYAGNKKLLATYRQDYRKWVQLKTELELLLADKNRAIQEKDYILFQLEEITAIQPELINQEDLESELQLLEHAGSIRQITIQANELITEQEQSIASGLSQLYLQISPLAKINKQLASLSDRLLSAKLELEDLSSEMAQLGDSIEMDPAREYQIRETLDQLYRLLTKHQLKSITELLDLQSTLQTQNTDFEILNQRIADKQEEIKEIQVDLENTAEKLSTNRKKAASSFEKSIVSSLGELGMPHAKFVIELKPTPELNMQGKDLMQFLFAANKGTAPAAIRDIASGGEISRLTLVIKSLVAAKIPLPTLIYDEIDTGLGGEIALKMSQIMQHMATDHQLIVITHSPQIAAKADKHLFVYKEVIKNNTFTQIKTLDKNERIEAIAIMLSTRPPSKAAIANAKELIK